MTYRLLLFCELNRHDDRKPVLSRPFRCRDPGAPFWSLTSSFVTGIPQDVHGGVDWNQLEQPFRDRPLLLRLFLHGGAFEYMNDDHKYPGI